VLDALLDVSKKFGKSPAQIALNWLTGQPGVTSVILGARTLAQLEDNLASLSFTIPPELRERLNIAGAPEAVHPYNFYVPWMQARVSGNVTVAPWRPANIYAGATAPPPEQKAAS
jgi:diketogulonate reductase-like aldo/keto reductase